MPYPKWLKKGGGVFSGDGTLTDYNFIIGESKQGSNGKPFQPVTLQIFFKKDGADEATPKRLLIGSGVDYDSGESLGFALEADGKVLVTPNGVSGTQEAGLFLTTLFDEKTGFPASRLPDDDTRIDLRPVIGTRLELSNDVDVEATKKRGKEKGSDGKEYDRRKLTVAKVYSAAATSVPSQPATTKTMPNVPSEIDEKAAELLIDALQSNSGTLKKSELTQKIVLKANKEKYGAEFVKVRSRAYSASFLATMSEAGVIVVDGEGAVILAAVPA